MPAIKREDEGMATMHEGTRTDTTLRTLRAGLGAGAILLLAGCGWFRGDAGSCDKNRLNGYVGRSVESLPELSGVTRVIEPDTMVTQDYWPTRLNVDVNEAGTITRVWCG
ncbi:I78 family peptidase inhibitor [Citreimonas sp.]|uniref:I78 family peptidase inhibitor n=1 Tax=Citreimonas sp. TaxID=3036715 RepID=UPI0040595C70